MVNKVVICGVDTSKLPHITKEESEELLLMDQISDEGQNDEKWAENVALKNAVKRLGEREKKILYMRYYEGKTQTEISTAIGLSQAQVSRLEKTHFHQ